MFQQAQHDKSNTSFMKVGITGGIGSGKSYVCAIIKDMGYPVYDCDSEAKRLMVESPQIIQCMTSLLGTEAYHDDGSLNKPLIAQFLFKSNGNAETINSIVHPVVKEDFLNWADKQQTPLVFMESAILFESGFNSIVDRTVAVCAPTEVRIQRAMQRDNSTREQIEARIRQQMTDEQCRSLADSLIENDGKANIKQQIHELIQEFLYFL